MTVRQLSGAEVGLPRHAAASADGADGNVFGLSSHERARDALDFGLSVSAPGYNIFVVGEDRSGRMTATYEFLKDKIADRPVPNDWVYLNNFREPHRPQPYALPAGVGRKLCNRMAALLPQLREALSQAFTADAYTSKVREAGEALQAEISGRIEAIGAEAAKQGLQLVQTPQGLHVVPMGEDGKPLEPQDLPAAQRESLEQAAKEISEQVHEVQREAARRKLDLANWMTDFNRQVAENAVGDFLDEIIFAFQTYGALAKWLVEMRSDLLENIGRFLPQDPAKPITPAEQPEQRYAVNLLVDHGDESHPDVVLEPTPTMENLFGLIEYRQVGGILETDFTLIRPGAIHKANGGILVLRAESLAAAPHVWARLKSALRDQAIHIEEMHRQGTIPIAGSPRPMPIPLDLKVVIVGAPRWYYAFFSVDPEFRSYFKIKADVDEDMEATPDNVARFTALVCERAKQHGGYTCDPAAVDYLLGYAARWSSHRDKLTARIELVEDTLQEAALHLRDRKSQTITEDCIKTALVRRRRRNARAEDKLHEHIAAGTVMIDTSGQEIGQVNALTVRDLGDHAFGTPSRVTARASVGRRGVINIERDIAMSGPIQQKGVMVLQGFLAGHFARRFPLSFNCSITFEQSYGGVEGDSASMAELIAIVSDIAAVPVRQDLAITGSVNQRGQSQAVGGVHHKVEGFYRTCIDAGGLTGEQGVVVPQSNAVNLVLRDEVAEAVDAGRFHVWSVDTVDEAIGLFLGIEAGEPDADGTYPPDSVFGRVAAKLEDFDRILAAREGGSV